MGPELDRCRLPGRPRQDRLRRPQFSRRAYAIGGIHKGQPIESWQEDAKSDPALVARVQWLFKRPAEELYDLETDPHEMKNLADNPNCGAIKTRLRRQLDEWMTQQGDRGLETELIARSRQAKQDPNVEGKPSAKKAKKKAEP